jgi:hypothetical protein
VNNPQTSSGANALNQCTAYSFSLVAAPHHEHASRASTGSPRDEDEDEDVVVIVSVVVLERASDEDPVQPAIFAAGRSTTTTLTLTTERLAASR